jgi:hypothetical protein
LNAAVALSRLASVAFAALICTASSRTSAGLIVGVVVAQAFESETQKPNNLFGHPIGRIYGKYAVGSAPVSPWLMARAIRMVLGWRMRGRTWPHPFFERTPPAPKFPVTTLSPAEREALRPLCGPHPLEHRET